MNPFLQSLEKSLSALGITRQDRILVGVSGGMDSMVMLHALHHMNFQVMAAHVNFKIRGEESDGDALLVKGWCDNYHVPFLLKETDTKAFASAHNLNTQLAARKIRYDWWEELMASNQFDFVATAHHLDDQIETFFINILRGTGMKGLQGIPAHRNFLIRPMLDFSRTQIEAYAKDHCIPFRTDSSNLSDDYQRNKIRHHLVPFLNGLAPGFQSRMQHNFNRLNFEWKAWDNAYKDWISNSTRGNENGISIVAKENEEAFLLRWLEEKEIPWNLAKDFIFSKNKNSGQVLQTDTYRLSRTNDGFYFEKIVASENFIIPKPGVYFMDNAIFSIYKIDVTDAKWNDDPNEEYISSSVVQFPLQLRRIEPGDSFQPLGMQGKTKKIQDLLVDRKLEMHEKAKVRLLTNNNHVLWVVGIQLDERAKVKDGDEEVYVVSYKSQG